MSLARQFGFDVQPEVPTKSDGTPYTSLAATLRTRAQAQALAARTSLTNIPAADSEMWQAPDGSIQFTLYVDTTRAMSACRSVLTSKGVHFSKLNESKLLVMPHETNVSDQIVFELTVESLEGSACTSKIRFSVLPIYVTQSVQDASAWSLYLKELHQAVTSRFR